ncbi:MAG: cytochrome c family protein [Planctomycetales bacterium]|nr:cytochrome c family protein [Planctomycetales bacterium]
MTQNRRNVAFKFLAVAAAVAALLFPFVMHITAQEPATPEKPQFDFTNSDNCILCHGDTTRLKDHADFIAVAPAELWSKLDKHGQSFLLLKEKSRKLTDQILGFDLREAFLDNELTSLSDDEKLADKVSTVKSCLRCHATWPKDAVHPTGKMTEPVEPLSRGVSCQACHGPAGSWTDAHSGKWWRRVAHEAKSKLGFINVRDGVTRTELCVSCHVGNVAEEKFVKHEWYAAGHPPLPGFEYSAFAAQMPAHWKPLADKPDFAGRTATSPPVPDGKAERIVLRRRNIDIADTDIKANYHEANFPDVKAGDDPFVNRPRTQEVTISGVVVLKAYAGLARDYAQEVAQGNKRFNWPEFALYDCVACHHELRRQVGFSARPAGSGPPGRPPMPRWTSALLGLATERKPELDEGLRALELAFTQRPFGDPKKIAAAAKKLGPQLDRLCQELCGAKFDEERCVKSLAVLLGSSGTADTRDYASARQVAWAIQGLRQDQVRIPYGFDARLNADQQQSQDRIAAFFRRNERDELLLTLPARQEHSVAGELPKFLQAMSEYDAEWFAESLRQIKSELTKKE